MSGINISIISYVDILKIKIDARLKLSGIKHNVIKVLYFTYYDIFSARHENTIIP